MPESKTGGFRSVSAKNSASGRHQRRAQDGPEGLGPGPWWSKDSDKVHAFAHRQLPVDHPGRVLDLSEREDSGLAGVRIGVPASTPNTTTLVIVIVPPARSAGVALNSLSMIAPAPQYPNVRSTASRIRSRSGR
jgi:hypothetical protein